MQDAAISQANKFDDDGALIAGTAVRAASVRLGSVKRNIAFLRGQ
jgi:hypothetical protein